MKKFFSILAAFFLGLFISISIIACADNDDDSSLGQLSWAEFKELRNARVLKLVRSTRGDNANNWEYKYDDKGRISTIHRKLEDLFNSYPPENITYNVTYSGNTINIVDDREHPTRWEVTVSEGAMMVPFVVNEFIRDMIYEF